MKHCLLVILLLSVSLFVMGQLTPFEKSDGRQSATYFEAIDFYKQLDKSSKKIKMITAGPTDAGYPLHLVMLSADKKFDPVKWHSQNKVVILIINGIHPGEPDGIDASMLLARDIANGKITLPDNVCIGIIPVYNIGGCLNRNSYSRVNQDGPESYGFRGNSQNLDLNRDFTKCDSREARSFTEIFHKLDPDIQIDNHVSDGADYQYTMTMLTTQPDKLGGALGDWLKNKFEPSLYKNMYDKGHAMCPYVNFETTDFDKGMEAFNDHPRYSSGYAALWQTIAFTPETHMLKPFKDRTLSTYAFMQSVLDEAGKQAAELISKRAQLREAILHQTQYPLSWKVDKTQYNLVNFKGYEQATKKSEVTGLNSMYYDHQQPFDKLIRFYNAFAAEQSVKAPLYYIIPQGWHKAIDLLRLNKVELYPLEKDSAITVQVYRIAAYKSTDMPYETHHRNQLLKADTVRENIQFLKADLMIPLNQKANRFIIEMLEPAGADSYFAWNFFDAILQQKEGYSDYRWEDVAAAWLAKNPAIKAELEAKKKADAVFAKDASAQLNWVYKHSPYYEPTHNRYPVYRVNGE